MSKYKNDNNSKFGISFFEELFQLYYRQLLMYAYKFVNDRYTAEDIVQDVFLTLWNKREELDFEESIKPYLYKLTYNRAINYMNSYAVQQRLENTEDLDFQISMEVSDSDPYETLLLKDITDLIDSFIETFPPQRKKVFLLSRKDGLKYKEIAALFDISEKAVEKHISKALTDIRQYLIDSGIIFVLLLGVIS